MGKCSYSVTILNIDNRWRWVHRFTTLPLYPRGKDSRYPQDRRLGGLLGPSGCCGEEKIFLHCRESILNISTVQPVSCPYADWAIPPPSYKYVTSLMEMAPRKASSCANTQEFPSILLNTMLHYLVQRSRSLIPILVQINLVHKTPFYFLRSV
jgi:hypothetical protein